MFADKSNLDIHFSLIGPSKIYIYIYIKIYNNYNNNNNIYIYIYIYIYGVWELRI